MTECVTDDINFCVGNTIPTRTVGYLPNNKPSITSDLKELLNKKKIAFRVGDEEDLKVKIRDNKEVYRRKLENKLLQNSLQDV